MDTAIDTATETPCEPEMPMTNEEFEHWLLHSPDVRGTRLDETKLRLMVRNKRNGLRR